MEQRGVPVSYTHLDVYKRQALFLILFSYDVFDMKKAMKFCTVRTILSIIFLMVLIYPYWMMTGFLR